MYLVYFPSHVISLPTPELCPYEVLIYLLSHLIPAHPGSSHLLISIHNRTCTHSFGFTTLPHTVALRAQCPAPPTMAAMPFTRRKRWPSVPSALTMRPKSQTLWRFQEEPWPFTGKSTLIRTPPRSERSPQCSAVWRCVHEDVCRDVCSGGGEDGVGGGEGAALEAKRGAKTCGTFMIVGMWAAHCHCRDLLERRRVGCS